MTGIGGDFKAERLDSLFRVIKGYEAYGLKVPEYLTIEYNELFERMMGERSINFASI